MAAKTIAKRIKAVAILAHEAGVCSDATRRPLWVAAIPWQGGRKKVKRLRGTFHTKAEALKHAGEERDKWIRADRMPETMLERQQREDREEAAKSPAWNARRDRVAFDADVTWSENLDGSACEI